MDEPAWIAFKKPVAKVNNSASHTQQFNYSQHTKSYVNHIQFLQRTIGNQAVQRLIKSGALQAKLKISRPDDIYEQEADRVAEQVVSTVPGTQQRKSGKVSDGRDASVGDDFIHNLGNGQPLDANTRAFFEPRFGRDFSQVRIHTSEQAADAARAVNARAFTMGKDVVFGEREYAPGSAEGQRLLSHELAHVVQQGAGIHNITNGYTGNFIFRKSPPSNPMHIESIQERIRRLLSEFNDYVKDKKNEEAKALVPEIKQLVMGSSMSWDYAIPASNAFLSIGLTKDAFDLLKDARKQQPLFNRGKFSREVAGQLLADGISALARKDPENAYDIFLKLFHWSDLPEIKNEPSDPIEKTNLEFFRKEMYRDSVASLTSVVDYYVTRAEDAYKANNPEAPVLLSKARQVLDRLKKDLASVPGLNVVVAEPKLTRPGSEVAEYTDIKDPALKMQVKQYPGTIFSNYFSDRIRRIETILEAKSGQISSVKGFYEDDKEVVALYEKKYGRTPGLHNLDDRQKFWSLKYDFLINEGKNRKDALKALMDGIGNYLKAFTIHSKYDIPDSRTDILKVEFPRATTRQALMDCGVFAMQTAFELSLIRDKAGLDFYYVFMPIHVGLGIIDKGKSFGWALNNNIILPITGEDIARYGVARSVGFYFGYAPSPVEAAKIKGVTGKELIKEFQTGPDDIFVPPDLSELKGSAREKAVARGKQLKERYNLLKGQHMQLVKESTYHLLILRDKYKETGKAKPDEFKKFAIGLIEPLYTEYAAMSKKVVDYYGELVEFRGGISKISASISGYYQNTYYMLRYLAYVLGKEDFSSKEYIGKPIFKPAELDYKGIPPPWEKGIYDFAED